MIKKYNQRTPPTLLQKKTCGFYIHKSLGSSGKTKSLEHSTWKETQKKFKKDLMHLGVVATSARSGTNVQGEFWA